MSACCGLGRCHICIVATLLPFVMGIQYVVRMGAVLVLIELAFSCSTSFQDSEHDPKGVICVRARGNFPSNTREFGSELASEGLARDVASDFEFALVKYTGLVPSRFVVFVPPQPRYFGGHCSDYYDCSERILYIHTKKCGGHSG